MNTTDSDFPDVIIRLKRRDDKLERRVKFAFGRRNFFQDSFHERLKVAALVVHIFFCNALLGCRVDNGEIKLLVVGVKLHEKFENFVVNFIDASFGAVNFIYHDDWFKLMFKSLA